jgi:protein-disulfide isomerase
MLGVVALAIGAAGAVAAITVTSEPPVNTSDRAAIEKIVREYILSHPEILPEAMANLEAREAKQLVETHRAALEKPFGGAWAGNANGDVTLVEFFDYQCGYCRASLPDIDRLLAEDKQLKIVYREIPILGPNSLLAAQASLSVAQGIGYTSFHRTLFAAGPISANSISAAIKAAGTDEQAINAANRAESARGEIEQNLELQRSLNLTGTPAWVVGTRVLNGAVGYDELKKAIAEARAAR